MFCTINLETVRGSRVRSRHLVQVSTTLQEKEESAKGKAPTGTGAVTAEAYRKGKDGIASASAAAGTREGAGPQQVTGGAGAVGGWEGFKNISVKRLRLDMHGAQGLKGGQVPHALHFVCLLV